MDKKKKQKHGGTHQTMKKNTLLWLLVGTVLAIAGYAAYAVGCNGCKSWNDYANGCDDSPACTKETFSQTLTLDPDTHTDRSTTNSSHHGVGVTCNVTVTITRQTGYCNNPTGNNSGNSPSGSGVGTQRSCIFTTTANYTNTDACVNCSDSSCSTP